jgi:hypothetical protein
VPNNPPVRVPSDRELTPGTAARRAMGIVAATVVLMSGFVPAGTSVAGADEAPTTEEAGDASTTIASPEPATPQLIEAAVERGEITEAQGALYLSYAFSDPSALPAAYRSLTPWDGTVPLLELQRTLARLPSGSTARLARAQLRAPSFTCPNFSSRTPNRLSTRHFFIQFDRGDLRNLVAVQYANALEQTFTAEVRRFGWPRPPNDPVRHPPGSRYPVRIERLSGGLYGYVTGTHIAGNNPATPWPDRDSVASCMVMNENYGPFPGTPLNAMRATAAHEYNHSIQFGYGALTGFGRVSTMFIEASATWMEDLVFEGANDNVNYLWPQFVRPMGAYDPAFPYPYWVVLRAMTERFGMGVANGSEAVFQRFWEEISRGRSTNLAALQRGFRAKGTTLGIAYHDASIALRYLRNCAATDPRYCLNEGPLYASSAGPNSSKGMNGLTEVPDSERRERIANDYALQWFALPTDNGAAFNLRVTHNGVGILRVSVACLTGSTVTVTRVGTATSSLDAQATVDPSGCDLATAVVSNVKATSSSPSFITRTTYSIFLT